MQSRLLSRTMQHILLAILVIITGLLTYQYIVATSTQIDAKTGTFVEALTPGYEISYIPYTQTSDSTRLYQSFLFDACLDYKLVDGRVVYDENLCSITTQDNQNFVVRLKQDDRPRARGGFVSLDDLYATYQKILIENVWSIPSFESYKDIAIERRAEDLVVTFPEASIDNRIFFTYFIIPEAMTSTSFADYVTLATAEEIGSGCGRVRSGTRDTASIVFDLSACEDTNMDNYQLKYISEFVDENPYAYIDAIKGQHEPRENFVTHRIPKRQFAFLFFNVESPKLSPKIQRALGGYINHHFRDESIEKVLLDNQLVFNHFLSTGDNVANYIAAKNPELPIDKYDLEKLNIKPLPTEIKLQKGAKPVYFLESLDGSKTMRILLDESYDTISIKHNTGAPYTPKTYNAATKSFFYTVAPYNANLVEGLNEYTIVGKKDGQTTTIADMDVYFLTQPLQENATADDNDKIHIVYIYHPLLDVVVDRLKVIFDQAGMGDFFVFDGYDDPDNFEGRLLSQDYDMVLRLVDLGQRNDWRSLFAGKNPILNPSLYSAGSFVTALGQYANHPGDQAVYNNILTIYGKDMPFVILGQLSDDFALRDPINQQISSNSFSYMYDTLKDIYEKVTLGTRMSISRSEIFNKNNFYEFVRQGDSFVQTGTVTSGAVATPDETVSETGE